MLFRVRVYLGDIAAHAISLSMLSTFGSRSTTLFFVSYGRGGERRSQAHVTYLGSRWSVQRNLTLWPEHVHVRVHAHAHVLRARRRRRRLCADVPSYKHTYVRVSDGLDLICDRDREWSTSVLHRSVEKLRNFRRSEWLVIRVLKIHYS